MWYKQGTYLGEKNIENTKCTGIKISTREKNETLDDYGKRRAWEVLQQAKKLFKEGKKNEKENNIS